MPRMEIMQLVDDLDGQELGDDRGETVDFALDGTTYQIDLSTENAADLREIFREYIAAGRKVSAAHPVRRRRVTPTGRAAH